MKGSIIVALVVLFLSPRAFSQNWIWGREATNSGGMGEGYSVAVDKWSNAYITGFFEGPSMTFGSQTLKTSSFPTMYLAKYNSTGTAIWARKDSNLSNTFCEGNSVVTDKRGNVYVTGGFGGTIYFDTVKLNSYTDISSLYDVFLVKYDSMGRMLWAKQSIANPISSQVQANSVAVDDSGYIYIVGNSSNNKLYFDKDSINGGTYFIAKYDSNGHVLWTSGAAGSVTAYSVATDNMGGIYVTGNCGAGTLFDTTHVNGNGAFLVKYNKSGRVLWAKASSNGYTVGYSVASSMTNVYVTGCYNNACSFGSQSLPTPAFQDFFLVKYDSGGTAIWVRAATVIDDNNWSGYSIATDENGYIYCSLGANGNVRYFTDSIIIGKDVFNVYDDSPDGPSVIVKYDSSGNELCGAIIPGGGDDENALAVDIVGQTVYLSGDLEDTVICGNDTLKYEGSEVPFMAKWQPCKSYVGISRMNDDNQVKVWSNPSNGVFTIEEQGISNTEQVEVYNMLGEKIYDGSFTAPRTTINLTGQPAGIYLYRITAQKGELLNTGKLVIQ